MSCTLSIAGIQQARHPHGGSVFYVTGTTKQELFNTAEKTKESSVDDIGNLSISPVPDTSPDSFHEVPVDCPEEVPVDVPSDKAHGKLVCVKIRSN